MEVSARDFFKMPSNDRGTSWGEIETKVLIKIWADDTIQAMLNGLTHNHKVFLQISEVMKCRGYNRNPKQCREKIKKLRLEYKRIVGEKKNGSENGETTWKFFEAMHEVLGRPAPTCGRNSAAREEEDDDEDDEEDYDDYDDDETTTSEDEEEDGWMAEVRFAQGRKDPGSGQERTQEISKMSSGATGAIWTDAETKVLIEIWADDAIQAMLNTSRHNKEIYLQISEEMKFRGYNRGAKQCREKINKLRSLYKRIAEVKKNNSEKAGITWTFFKAMDEVLGRPAPQRPAVPLQTCGRNSAAREEEEDDDDDDDDETTTSEDEEEDEVPCVRHDAPRKHLVLFSTKHDIALLGEVVALNPFASREPGRMWDFVGDMVTDALQGNFEVDGKTCRERTMVLLDYYKKQDFPSLRRFGTERLYAKKEDLLRQVMELEAEKSSTVNGDGPKHQPEERRDQINEELALSEPEKPDITTLPPAGGMDVNTSSLLVAAEAEDERAPAAELPAAPAAKRPCHCCFQTYAGILSFLEKRSEADQRLREEELSFRRQELEIQRSKIALERERLEVERKERERRFELESQERQVILNLLKEKVLTG